MKNKENLRTITRHLLYLTLLLSFFILTHLSLPAYDAQDENGAVSGTIEVFRARHSGDVVVYLEGAGIKKEYPPPQEASLLDQKNLVFLPRVLPILKGTTVKFLNSDDVQHNIFAPGRVEKFNLGTWGKDGKKERTLNKPGEIIILCNVHSEMVAYIIILENPFYFKTDEDGHFKIENIPPGDYQLRTWHEKMKLAPQKITVTGGETTEVNLELSKRK